MKKNLQFFSATAILVLLLAACSTSDDSNQPPIYVLPSDADADFIATAFSSAAGGINFHLENSAILAGRTYSSSATIDSNFLYKKLDSAATVKYTYSVNYSFARLTTSPPKFTLTYESDGSFSSPLVKSAGSQTGNYTVTGLDTTSADYTLTGTDNVGGAQESLYYKVIFTSSFRVTYNNIKLDKVSHMVISGTASIGSSGTGPSNIPFSYSGTITFIGNRLATLVFNGTTFHVDLATAKITK